MPNRLKLLASVFAAAFITGCTSLDYHADYEGPEVYPGVRKDYDGMTKAWSEPFGPVAVGYCIIDLPFSFVVDTLFLPSDAIQAGRQKPAEPAPKAGTNNVDH